MDFLLVRVYQARLLPEGAEPDPACRFYKEDPGRGHVPHRHSARIPPGRAVRSGMGEQSHLILLPEVVRVGHWGSVSLRNPGWPMIFLPLSAHLTCCVCQVKLLFSEPMS